MPDDKTSFTKASVQGSDETTSSREQAGKPDLNDVDEKGIPWRNRAEEYRKKYEAVAEKAEKLEAAEERLAELEEKFRLTEAEKAEKERLEKRTDNLERELYALDNDPQYRAFREKIKTVTEKTKSEAIEAAAERFYRDAVDDLIDEQIEGLREYDKELTVKSLKSKLQKLVRAEHMDLNPLRRTKAVLKEFKQSLERDKQDADRRKRDEEENRYAERDGRAAREMSFDEAKKKGDVLSQIKSLGKYK